MAVHPGWLWRALAAFWLAAAAAWPVAGQVTAATQGPAKSPIVAWGLNPSGLLVQGQPESITAPVAIASLEQVKAVACGPRHSLALKEDGTVWAWGANGVGQVGDGTLITRPTPVQVTGLSDVVGISSHGLHSLAVKADGTVWVWGQNEHNEAGLVPKTKEDTVIRTPVQVKGLKGVTAVSAGEYWSLALADGTVYAWGYNLWGRLGLGNTAKKDLSYVPEPTAIVGLPKIAAIAAGSRHGLALDTDGNVWAWGEGGIGQLGVPKPASAQGFVMFFSATPVQVKGLGKVKSISTNSHCCMALTTTGKVMVWGQCRVPTDAELQEQLKEEQRLKASNTDSVRMQAAYEPMEVAGLDGVAAIAAGSMGTMYAVKEDGTVWAWGRNRKGSVGNGEASLMVNTPVQVKDLTVGTIIDAGWEYALAVRGEPEDFLKWYFRFSQQVVKSRLEILNQSRLEAAMIGTTMIPLQMRVRELRGMTERAAKTGEEVDNKLVVAFREQGNRLVTLRTRLDVVCGNAKQALEDIRAEVTSGERLYGAKHPEEFAAWKKMFDEMATKLPYELALASHEDNQLAQLAGTDAWRNQPVDVQIEIARGMLRRGDILGALQELRDLSRTHSSSEEARKALGEAQVIILKVALQKADSGAKTAQQAFDDYLKACGYWEVSGKPAPLLWRAMAGPLNAQNRQLLYQDVICAVGNLWDAMDGKLPDDVAKKADRRTQEMVDAYLAIQVIIRLCSQGHTVDQLQDTNREDVFRWLPTLRKASGMEFTPEEKLRLWVSIQRACGLPDIKAMAEGDMPGLAKALGARYVDAGEIADTWRNTFCSTASEFVLTLALPAAMVGEAGEAVRLSTWLSQTTRWDKAVAWIVRTDGGTYASDLLISLGEYQNAAWEAGAYGKWLAAKGGEFVAEQGLQALVTSAGERYGGSAGNFAGQAICLLTNDTPSLMRLMRTRNLAGERMLRFVDDYIKAGSELSSKLAADHEVRVKLAQIAMKKAAGKYPLNDAEVTFLKSNAQTVPTPLPDGSAVNDVTLSARLLANEVLQGAQSGGLRTLNEFEQVAAQEMRAANEQVDAARKARDRLAGFLRQQEGSNPPKTVKWDERKLPNEVGGGVAPPEPHPGSQWALAEEAMNKGDYAKALELYQKAMDANEIPARLAVLLMDRAREAGMGRIFKATSLKPDAVMAKMTRAVESDEIKQCMASMDKWRALPNQGVSGAVMEVPDCPGLLVKEINLAKFTPKQVMGMAEAEVTNSALAREMGFPVPGVTAVVERDDAGALKSVRLFMRRVDGVSMDRFSTGEAYQFRKQSSELIAFSRLTNDFDRKVDNFVWNPGDNRVYAIDGSHALADLQMIPENPDMPFMNQGPNGLRHWYDRSWSSPDPVNGQVGGIQCTDSADPKYAFYVKQHLFDRSLTCEDAAPAIGRIQAQMADPARRAAIQQGVEESLRPLYGTDAARVRAQEIMQTRVRRAQQLPDILKPLDERTGKTAPGTSQVWPVRFNAFGYVPVVTCRAAA